MTRPTEESDDGTGARPAPTRRLKLVTVVTVPSSLIFFQGQARYFRERAIDVAFVSSPGSRLDSFARAEGAAAFAVEMPRRISPVRDLLAVSRLWLHLRQLRPDIVHAHTPKGGLLGTLAAFLARTPTRIYHLHGLPLSTARGPLRQLLRWTEKTACLLATDVLCVSRSVRALAVDEGLCAPGKIRVLAHGSSNGVDADHRFNPERLAPGTRVRVRAAHGIPAEAAVVGFVGRLVRDKGIGELYTAWRALRESHPHLHLLVVGPFEERDALTQELRRGLLEDPRIHLAGAVPELASFYGAMDVVALPTYREGLPNVALEVAAMRLPLVATRVTGCVDAVVDGVTGTLVPPGDAVALAAALRRYLDDAPLRRRHGQSARDHVLRHFRPQVIWDALCDTYREAAGQAPAAVARGST